MRDDFEKRKAHQPTAGKGAVAKPLQGKTNIPVRVWPPAAIRPGSIGPFRSNTPVRHGAGLLKPERVTPGKGVNTRQSFTFQDSTDSPYHGDTRAANSLLKLQQEINLLREQNEQLTASIEERKGSTNALTKLNQNVAEMQRKILLQDLFFRVNADAQTKLLESEQLRSEFENPEPFSAMVLSMDIRRSTEMMLKARSAKQYAHFIIELCNELTETILRNYGIYDKFTGDGILAFFPEFFTGRDTSYWAVKAARECHEVFKKCYAANRKCFVSVVKDIGLGIGMDFGKVTLVRIQGTLSVLGPPVVYSCRLSGCEAGKTLLNQQAFEVISQKYGDVFSLAESEMDIKHEGRILAYMLGAFDAGYSPALPDWATPNRRETRSNLKV
jgi:class 3 adenylate cyclase